MTRNLWISYVFPAQTPIPISCSSYCTIRFRCSKPTHTLSWTDNQQGPENITYFVWPFLLFISNVFLGIFFRSTSTFSHQPIWPQAFRKPIFSAVVWFSIRIVLAVRPNHILLILKHTKALLVHLPLFSDSS